MIPRTFEILGTTLVLLAVWRIGAMDVRGQYLMLVAQVVWFAWAIMGKHGWLAFQSAFLAVLTVNAIIEWRLVLGAAK